MNVKAIPDRGDFYIFISATPAVTVALNLRVIAYW